MNDSVIKLGLEKLKQEWEPKGFKCDLYRTKPGESWSNPGHKTDEFIILIEGEVEVSFQNKVYHPQVGELLKIPAYIHHTFANPGKITSCIYWIYAYNWQYNKDGSVNEEGKIVSPEFR